MSTDDEDQLNSYRTQKSYYTELIKKNPKWRFAGIYADEGITGTMVKKRDDFLRIRFLYSRIRQSTVRKENA